MSESSTAASNRLIALERENARLTEENAKLKATLSAKQLDFENRENACCPEDMGFEEYIRILRATVERLQAAVDWALGGEGSNFRGQCGAIGAYWWRKELRARAAQQEASK